jgi:hypothetical protein
MSQADCQTHEAPVPPECRSNSARFAPNGFAMFTSDMEWHLGRDPKTDGTCTYDSAGQVVSGEARGDVWIDWLNPAATGAESRHSQRAKRSAILHRAKPNASPPSG